MNKSVYDGSHRFSGIMTYFYVSRNIGWDIYRQDELSHKISRYDKRPIESKSFVTEKTFTWPDYEYHGDVL
jgi:hypothetical protein